MAPTTAPTRQFRLPRLAFWLLVALPAALALARGWFAAASMAPLTGCLPCSFWMAVGNDAWLVAIAWLLLALARIAPHGVLRAPAVVLVLLLTLAMTADLAILATLNMRLYLADVFKFGGEASAIGGFLAALLRSDRAWQVLLAGTCLLLSCGALLDQRRSRRSALGLGALALAAVVFAAAAGRQRAGYIHDETFDNLVALHRAQAVNQPYSPGRAAELLAAPAPPPQCEPGQQRRPDIVLLIVESLSAYHSGLSGGRGLTPELDAFARRHSWIPEFYANGFTTDQGLIALLNGRVPLPAVGRYGSLDAFGGFARADDALPSLLEPYGYSTHFFSTGDLGFLDKPSWLRGIGFDHWEGAEHPFYQGWPRGGFNAAEDRALFLRFLDWLAQREPDAGPFAAALLTVESHPPFVDRDSGRTDEAKVLRRVDAAIGDFVEALEARGFFDHGVLLVTGDHRSMTPLHDEEFAAWGERAFARVPMIIAGAVPVPHGPIDGAFQQSDLLPSLQQLVAPRACHRPDQGRFLRPDPQPPAWILHVRGSPRDRVDVYLGDTDAAFRMAGDDSGWLVEPPVHADAIAAQIERGRVVQGIQHSDLPGILRLLGFGPEQDEAAAGD